MDEVGTARTKRNQLTAGWAERQQWTMARLAELAVATGEDRKRIEAEIVLRHLDLVEGIARRLSGSSGDEADLRQVGCIGLIKAVRRFDAAQGQSFVAFAMPTISGEIKRHLRDNGWTVRPPRPVQELRAAARIAGADLAQQLGREPTEAEIARRLGCEPDAVAEALDQRTLHPLSLDLPAGDDANTLGSMLRGTDDQLQTVELRFTLRRALACLTPRERRIVYLRFIEERTQQEIATAIGVTQMQVSRLLGAILKSIRLQLADGIPEPSVELAGSARSA